VSFESDGFNLQSTNYNDFDIKGPWKYIAFGELVGVTYPPQLFNLDEDPDELGTFSSTECLWLLIHLLTFDLIAFDMIDDVSLQNPDVVAVTLKPYLPIWSI